MQGEDQMMAPERHRSPYALWRPAAAVGLLAAVAGCTHPGEVPPAVPPAGLVLRFEDRLSPDAFRFQGPAMRAAASDVAGSWAAVPGLPRPERAEVVSLATGARTTVALFSGDGGVARLSDAAADALGLAPEARIAVRITALREEPRLSAAGETR